MTLRTQALRVGAALALTIAGMGAASVPAVAEDAVCATGGGYADPFYPGPGSSSPYDGTFANGAPINASLIDGDYVPQGLAWWPNWNGTGTSALLITAYHDPDHDKVPDRTSAIFGLEMNGASYVRGLGSCPDRGWPQWRHRRRSGGRGGPRALRSGRSRSWRRRDGAEGVVGPPPCAPVAAGAGDGATERRAWDSNPREACTPSGFQDRRTRPLCEPSNGR